MSKAITSVTLLLSVSALCVSIASYRAAHTQAAAAIREREQQLINRLNPQLQQVYGDFQLKLSSQAKSPHSLEDMLEPLLRGAGSVTTRPAVKASGSGVLPAVPGH